MRKLSEINDPDEVRAAFKEYLREGGIKYTSARRVILDVVLEMHDHFEAEQVVYSLKGRGNNVGKATVYRTLPLLVDCGILKQVRFDVKQAFYEHDFGQKPHDHMVCRACGRIVEFDSDELIALRKKIGKRHQFRVTDHHIQLIGTCSECEASTKRATDS